MTDCEKLIKLACALKSLHSERQLQDDLTPHTNVMKMRCAAKAVAGDIKVLVDQAVKEILSGREKETLLGREKDVDNV